MSMDMCCLSSRVLWRFLLPFQERFSIDGVERDDGSYDYWLAGAAFYTLVMGSALWVSTVAGR